MSRPERVGRLLRQIEHETQAAFDEHTELFNLNNQLKAENAKLRELVARIEHARRDLCDAYPDAEQLDCEECPAWSACRGDLMDRMRELRVEDA
jgi:hypothetical protein